MFNQAHQVQVNPTQMWPLPPRGESCGTDQEPDSSGLRSSSSWRKVGPRVGDERSGSSGGRARRGDRWGRDDQPGD